MEELPLQIPLKNFKQRAGSAVQKLIQHKVLFAILISFVLNLTLESLCRRSLLKGLQFLVEAPMPFFYGVGIILLTVSLVGLVRHRCFALLLVSIFWIALGVVECVLMSFRITPLTAVDFRLIFSVFSILDVYLNTFQVILIVLVTLAVLAGLVVAFLKLPVSEPVDYLRSGFGCVAAGLYVWGTTVLFTSTGILATQFDNLGNAYNAYGFTYCFSTSLFDRGITQPEDYSPEEVGTVVDELDQEKPEEEELDSAASGAESKVMPNIVAVQLESFMDVKYLKGLTYSQDPVPNFTALKEFCSTGLLSVPSIGAGTANTEFEILSGMSLDYFGTGEYPYETILQSNVCESVNYALKEEGYACHAIHNHTGTFYDRNKVYANLGFDTFTSVEYMLRVERNPLGWAKDAPLTEEILKALDSTPGQDMVYTVSVQPHGKYPTEVLDPDQPISVVGELEGINPISFEYYVNQIYETDAFVGQLVQALAERDEPTVLILFGDHLPNFAIQPEYLSKGDLLQTEYVIWNNMGLPKEDEDLEAYQLMATVLGQLGYHDGVLTKLHQDRDTNPDYQEDLQMLGYDLLYGDYYAYDGRLPYEPTDLQMGILPITVKRADNLHDELYVTGQNFTECSQISINGKLRSDTIFINSSTLMLPATTLEPLDVVAVSQVTAQGEALSQSNQFTYVGS